MCATGITVWLLVGGAGSVAAVTSATLYRKRSTKNRLIAEECDNESHQLLNTESNPDRGADHTEASN
jgi:hypothetical protein